MSWPSSARPFASLDSDGGLECRQLGCSDGKGGGGDAAADLGMVSAPSIGVNADADAPPRLPRLGADAALLPSPRQDGRFPLGAAPCRSVSLTRQGPSASRRVQIGEAAPQGIQTSSPVCDAFKESALTGAASVSPPSFGRLPNEDHDEHQTPCGERPDGEYVMLLEAQAKLQEDLARLQQARWRLQRERLEKRERRECASPLAAAREGSAQCRTSQSLTAATPVRRAEVPGTATALHS